MIALSQAKYFLGYDIERSSKIVPLIKSIIAGADGVCFACMPKWYNLHIIFGFEFEFLMQCYNYLLIYPFHNQLLLSILFFLNNDL